MSDFTIHTNVSAPEGSRALLNQAQRALGFVPNLYGLLAAAPSALRAYRQLTGLLEESSLSTTELQLVLLEVSVENGCDYCVAAHSTIAGMQLVAPEVIAALRTGNALDDRKLQALRVFARSVVVTRGRVSPTELQAFFAAGYSAQQSFEITTAIALKTLSNYSIHLADIPLDDAFQQMSWSQDQIAPAAQ